jgi:hypothetical protein
MFATLAGHQIVRGSVTIPLYGTWTADVWLADATVLEGTVALVIGDLTLKSTITRGGSYTGQASYRLVGGAGGWMREAEAKQYRSPFGVKASNVLKDVAAMVGETVSVTSDRTLGQFWSVEKAPAARALQQIGISWWLREDGVTIVGPRATPTITSPFEVIRADLEKGRVEVATDFPSQWLPGAKFMSAVLPKPQQISAVTHTLSASKFRTEVWNVG